MTELCSHTSLSSPVPLRVRQVTFIEILAATGLVSSAAAAVGKTRTSAYRLRNRSDATAFRDAWDQALTAASAVLGEIAFDRAINGVEHPVYHKGELVGTRVKYNDRLLMMLLRVRDPHGFAPISEVTGVNRITGGAAEHGISASLTWLEANENAWQETAHRGPPVEYGDSA